MNREQLKEKIEEELNEYCLGQIPNHVFIDKLFLLFDHHQEDTKDKPLIVAYHVRNSNLWSLVQKNKGFTDDELSMETDGFLESRYPEGGDKDKILQHWYNYMKKRKPQQEGGFSNITNY